MREELLPCPSNCGSHRLVIHGELGTFYARCNCGWEGPAMPTEKLAIDAWNTRPDSKPYKWKTWKEWWGSLPFDGKTTYKAADGFNAAREREE